jgi:hypothetical protein
MISIFKKKQRKLKTYNYCKTLPMFNFYEIMETEEYRWLLKDFNDDSDISLSEEELNALKELFQTLFNEYIELKKDNKVLKTLKQRAIIANLENRMFWGATLLKLFINNPTEETAESLRSWKFKIDITKPLDLEFESVTKQLKSLRTKINMEVSAYEKMVENKNKSKEKLNIEKQAINVAKGLDLKYPINTKETTMVQWLAYCENLEYIIKENKKRQNKNG